MADPVGLPPGFVLENQQASAPALPPGFHLEGSQQPANQNVPSGDDVGAGYAAMSGFNSAVPFGNRITAGIAAPIIAAANNPQSATDFLNKVGSGYDEARANQIATNQAHPGANLAGTLAGIGATLPIGGEIPGASAINDFVRAPIMAEGGNLATKAANLGAKSLKSATVAAPVGALYGAGDAPEGQQLEGAGRGALVAGSIAGALPVAGAAYNAGKNALTGINDVLSQLTPAGREKIIGKIFNQVASDPKTALQNIKSAQELIPGSPFTTGEASADPGIISLQRGIRNSGTNPFSDIESQQNTARNITLNNVAGSPADLKSATNNRNIAAKGLYNQAYNSGAVNSDRIQEFLTTPELKSGIGKGLQIQRLESMAAGEPFRASDYSITGFNEAGDPIIGDVPNMRLLDAGKKGLDAMISAQTDPVTGKVNELGRALTQFKTAYLNELDNINPAYKAARSQYADMSKPINQMQTMQDIQGNVSLNSAPDIQTGHPFLSQPNLTRALKDPEVQQILSPEQMQKLQAIEADMNRSASLNQRNIRASGSDTAANQGTAQSLGSMFADQALGKIPMLGDIIKSSSQKGLNGILIQALRDPQYAAKLMQNTQTKNSLIRDVMKLPPTQAQWAMTQLQQNSSSQPEKTGTLFDKMKNNSTNSKGK